jgi:hypothetical protein
MKPIQYDRHAKRRMKDRAVSQEETQLAIENPDSLEKSVKGRSSAFKFMNGRYLRVTFKEELDHVLVVTVTVRKKPFGGQYENRIQ